MRRLLGVTAATLFVAACSTEPVGPANLDTLDELESTIVALGMPVAGRPGVHELAHLHRLPENLKLSAAQKEQISAILSAFETTTRSDREALAAIGRQVAEAKKAGKSATEIRAIADQSLPILQRLAAAESAAREKILAVLTAEQRAWLVANTPARCDRAKFPPLTEAQKSQIRALEAAFRHANAADHATIEAAMKKAREAHAAGKPESEIRAILESARPAMDRVAAARRELAEKISAIYTAEQKASGCAPALP